MTDTTRSIAEIACYHAHIYFDNESSRADAAILRDQIAARFKVRMGRWHDKPVGPHSLPMYQVAFETTSFASLVPWLMINHRGLSILIHPSTRNAKRDHLIDRIFIGKVIDIRGDHLPEDMESPDGVGELNTNPDHSIAL